MIVLFIKLTNYILCRLTNLWCNLKIKSFDSIQYQGGGKFIGSFYIRVKEGGKIFIGRNVTIVNGLCYNPISRNNKTALFVENNASLHIGNNVGISGSCLWAHKSIIIGNNVKIGGDSIIIDSDCHSLNADVRRGKDDQKNKCSIPIIIENDVLIGTRSIILKGVRIGTGSVVGAGSVVTRNIPSGEIWAGNPAKFIKKI